MSLVARLMGAGPTGFGYGSTTEDVTRDLDLTGRRYLVTGCNSGLGFETARVLTARGATVVGTARTEAKAAGAVERIEGEVLPVVCELAEPASVRAAVEAAAAHGPYDGIIANAGVMALPRREVVHGVELQLLTNHVGHAILVTGLLEHLTPTGRVVMLSSSGHQLAPAAGVDVDDWAASRGYSAWRNYGQSKLANLLFARALATRLPEGQTANAVHPGVIATNLTRHQGLIHSLEGVGQHLFMKSIPQGAATQVYVATHPAAAGVSGEYWADCNIRRSSGPGADLALAERVWEATEALIADLP